MTSRPSVSVQNPTTGELGKKIGLPVVFQSPIRPDIVQTVHANLNKNRRQAHGVDPNAGMKHSAESWGTGRAVSRIPRVSGSGTHRSGQAAFGNECRKGRMFAPLHTWRRWHRRVNIKQKRHAVSAAIAGSGLVPLVLARGHRVQNLKELPLVVDDSFEAIKKTKQAVQALKTLGAFDDVRRVIKSKKLRAGKGKLRGKRFQNRLGPLIVYATEDAAVIKAVRNIPGVDVNHVSRLNLLQLAPGGQIGRLIIWTESAFKSLNSLFGTYKYSGILKHGYQLKRSELSNADIAGIINSNEVQSKLRAKRSNQRTHSKQLRNPLKNHKIMDQLNPLAKSQRLASKQAEENAIKRRQQDKAKNRISKQDEATIKQRKKNSQKWIKGILALQQEANVKGIAEETNFRIEEKKIFLE